VQLAVDASSQLLSWMDLYNFAFHLTHHRFPQVHWADLPELHAASLPEYQRRGSPLSYGLDSSMLFNPVARVVMAYPLNRDRNRLLRG